MVNKNKEIYQFLNQKEENQEGNNENNKDFTGEQIKISGNTKKVKKNSCC